MLHITKKNVEIVIFDYWTLPFHFNILLSVWLLLVGVTGMKVLLLVELPLLLVCSQSPHLKQLFFTTLRVKHWPC